MSEAMSLVMFICMEMWEPISHVEELTVNVKVGEIAEEVSEKLSRKRKKMLQSCGGCCEAVLEEKGEICREL